MPFRFKKKESVNEAVRRLCRERIARARKSLKKCERLEALHATRKEIKKLRAVLRLVRKDIGKKSYCKETKVLRKAANYLAAARDAHVKLMTFENLRNDFKSNLSTTPFVKIRNILRENCRNEIQRFQKDKSFVNRILRKAKQRAGDLKIKSDGWTAIEAGLKKSYSRGRKAFRLSRHNPLPENFHEWRRRAKDLGYQLRLLCPVQPVELRAMTDELEKLSNHLGDDHDLVMLKQFIADACNGKAKEIKALKDLIDLRQRELRCAAEKIGSQFYAEKSAQFCARLKNYWNVWR